jgi:hypothetical protein
MLPTAVVSKDLLALAHYAPADAGLWVPTRGHAVARVVPPAGFEPALPPRPVTLRYPSSARC